MTYGFASNRSGGPFNDVLRGLRLAHIWLFLSYQDVISRYRRSLFGPLWVAGVMASQAIALTIVFGTIFRTPVTDFLPFVICGLSVFMFYGAPFNEGAEAFMIYRSTINAYPLPLSFHIFRMVAKHFIVLLHNLVVFLAVFLVLRHTLSIDFLFIPGLILSIIFVIGCNLATSTICARFRDVKFMLPYLWTLVFFLSPVIWRPSQMKGHVAWVYKYNPWYYMLETIRQPLMGEHVTLGTWLIAIASASGAALIGLGCFAFYRKKVPLWV